MIKIKDADGNEFLYWPVSGLEEGEVTGTILVVLEVTDGPAGGTLSATNDARIAVMARAVGVGAFQNIASNPIDLEGLPNGDNPFEVYLEALSGIVGVERVSLTVSAASSRAAGWLE